MAEQMILGSAFCKEQAFTNFHLRLTPWNEKLSNTRVKRARGVEHTAIADDIDEKQPYNCDELELLPCPLSNSEARKRHRSRVTTPCEKIDQFAANHSSKKAEGTLKQAGRRRASKHIFAPSLTPNNHENRIPAKYNQVQSRHIANLLARRVVNEQKTLLKQFEQLRESDVVLTTDELELNNKPARVVSFDSETNKYTISLANPRGYWYATEDKLKSIDPPPAKDDFKACGIEQSTGQPTLDPLDKPVHRQYGKNVSPKLTARINILLEKYKNVFGKDVSKPCKFRPMGIELIPGANLPRNPRYWKNSPAQRAEVRRQLQDFMDMGIVTPSKTAIVSNVLLVKRPGMPGKFRFTIDFRELNAATVAAPWQMPDVESQLARLTHKKIFGCIDLSSYYHQIELESGSRFLTGFVTEDGIFEYQRVPMGLKNACAHAQSELQGAIDADPILRKFGLKNYFDDLPLAAETEDEFVQILEAVLSLGVTYNLKFNLEKSIFGVDSITHVGFIVNANGIEVDPQRIEALQHIEPPKSLKGVQSVLGVWNHIRNFIPNFSTRALPITNLVGKGKSKARSFVWTDECQTAFNDIKAATLVLLRRQRLIQRCFST
jgi:hypothetical protein